MPSLLQITAVGGGWTLFGAAALLLMFGELITRKQHEREMHAVEKRAELAEARAEKAETQRDAILMPLAKIADRTFRAIPGGGGDDVQPPPQA